MIDSNAVYHISYCNTWDNRIGDYMKDCFGWGGEWVQFEPSPGTGNIFEDAQFVDTHNFNFNYNETSPCIDAGAPSITDPDGTISDIGANYFNQGLPEVNQNINISEGWSWFSLNVSDEDMSLNNVLSSIGNSGILIKNQNGFATYYDDFGWYGFDSYDITSMYMLKSINSTLLSFTGTVVNTSTTPIYLQEGWSWISYLPQNSYSINDALISIGNSGILIKNQSGFATYYDDFGWYGLDVMDPGSGYMLEINGTAVLIYDD